MNQEELTNEFMELPETMKQKEIDILKSKESIAKVQYHLDRFENKKKVEIINEVDSSGKSIFSNETLRKSELYKRMAIDSSVVTLKEDVAKSEQTKDQLEIEFRYLLNRFRAIRTVLEMRKDN